MPLTVVWAPAGYGKTTAVVQWLDHSSIAHSWISLEDADNDPQWFAFHLLGSLDRTLEGAAEPALRALHGGSGLRTTVLPLLVELLAERVDGRLAIVLDDYHAIHEQACHRFVRGLVDSAPPTVRVVIASRSPPPLRLARRRATGSVVEVGPEELRFEAAESARLLNDSLALGLEPADVDRIDEHVQGWAAGLVLVATALQSTDRAGDVLDAFARSRMSLHSYLVEEVLDNARPELRRFLCRTAVLNRLNAAVCEAVSGDRRAAALLDEVRTMTLFVNSVDPAGDWLRYHDLFADALRAELEKREPEIVGDLHHRAAAWFAQAGMPEDAIEHALAAGDGSYAASLLADSWLGFVVERRVATVRRFLDRLPPERGRFAAFCEALDVFCSVIEGVDQRISGARAERLAREHGDDPAVRLICDLLLVSPFHGDVGKALAYGREAWERYASDPDLQAQLLGTYALALWLSGELGSVRRLLEPRVRLDQPPYPKVSTLTLLGLIASDDGDARLGERYLREAVAYIEAIGAQTANEFTGIYGTLAETLRASGKLAEARQHMDRALEAESRRPGSLGHAIALIFDARLSLSEGDRRRASASAAQARAIIDEFEDVGTLADRLAAIESDLEHFERLSETKPTPAELRVLEALARDQSIAEIAAALYLSPNTIRSHRRRIYRKLGVSSREEAVELARQRGFLPAPPAPED